MSSLLPVHPSRRHPLTGEPIQAVWVRPDGRVMWPMLGGDDTVNPDGGSGGDTPPAGGGGPSGEQNDLGFPAETPVAEMTDKQQAAYWKHHSRKHETQYKDLLGGRKADEIKNDLAEIEKIRREQQTPAEQALTAAREQGKAEARTEVRRETALELFKGALEAGGLADTEIEDLATGFNVDAFISDKGVDRSKITNFAKRFSSSDTDTTTPRRRDFGAGNRGTTTGGPNGGRVNRGKAEAQRRFGKPTTGE